MLAGVAIDLLRELIAEQAATRSRDGVAQPCQQRQEQPRQIGAQGLIGLDRAGGLAGISGQRNRHESSGWFGRAVHE